MDKYSLVIYYDHDSDEMCLTEDKLNNFLNYLRSSAKENHIWEFENRIVFPVKVRSIEWWKLNDEE